MQTKHTKDHMAKATISVWLSKQHLVTLNLSSAGNYTQSVNITDDTGGNLFYGEWFQHRHWRHFTSRCKWNLDKSRLDTIWILDAGYDHLLRDPLYYISASALSPTHNFTTVSASALFLFPGFFFCLVLVLLPFSLLHTYRRNVYLLPLRQICIYLPTVVLIHAGKENVFWSRRLRKLQSLCMHVCFSDKTGCLCR